MSSQDVTLLLYLVVNSHGDLVSASFKHVYNFSYKHVYKINDLTIINLRRRIRELSSPKEELTLTILCGIGIMAQI